MSEDKAKQLIDNPVWIKGIGRKTLGAGLGSITGDLSSIEAAKNAARIAYKMANVEPDSIDVIELHDAFSILEIIAYEDLGLVSRGMGGKYVNLERTNINPRGGLLGCGHPIGATGVAQTVEIAAQLSEQAEGRQIKGCKTGLVQNLAAAGTSATVIILGV
jgi:acetyl-CoA C-acetyltransferase